MDNYANIGNKNKDRRKSYPFRAYVGFLKNCLIQDFVKKEVKVQKLLIDEFYKIMHLLDPASEDFMFIIKFINCMSDPVLIELLDASLKLENKSLSKFILDFYTDRIIISAKNLLDFKDLRPPTLLLFVNYLLRLAKDKDLISICSTFTKNRLETIKQLFELQTEAVVLDKNQIAKLWKMLEASKNTFDTPQYESMTLFLCQISQQNDYPILDNKQAQAIYSKASKSNLLLFSNTKDSRETDICESKVGNRT